MSAHHLLIVLAALNLFMMWQLNMNQTQYAHRVTVIESKITMAAMAIAQGYIERAQSLLFDEELHNGAPYSVTQFTSPNSLGPEWNESFEDFDDVDDFDGLVREEQNAIGEFTVRIRVEYVQGDAPDVPVITQTYYKRMWVTVENQYLPNPVVMGFLFCYF